MATRSVNQPANGTRAATDIVTLTQQIDAAGAVVSGAGDNSSVDPTGTTVPANATFVAGTDGTNTRALKTDSGGELQVDVLTIPALAAGSALVGNVGHAVTGISDGRKVVTTAGTRVTLAGSTAAKAAIITAETDNTGLIVVGGTTVVASLATRQGTPLNPGDTLTLEVDNLTDVNLDSTVSGDGVTFSFLT